MDRGSPLIVRIFVSSPGDVEVERARAADVIRRLQEEFVHARLESFFWEHEPARATSTFQDQIPPPSEMDIVICIFWARIGTRLPAHVRKPDGSPYASGTEYELLDAAEGFRKKGWPDLEVYRKISPPSIPIDDEAERRRRLEQFDALQRFIKEWFLHDDGAFKAAFNPFKTADEFERMLEKHLRVLIRTRVDKALGLTWPEAREVIFHGAPYRGLEPFGLEHAGVFHGRERALHSVKEALIEQAGRGCAFLMIFGMSGSGKSSLVRAGLLHKLADVPGYIPAVDLWRRCILRPGDMGGDLVASLAQAFFGDLALPELRAGGQVSAKLAKVLREHPADIELALRPALRAAALANQVRKESPRPHEARLLIAVDQLEEIFTREAFDDQQRAEFVAALAALATSGLAWVVATMRSDFYHRCADVPGLDTLKKDKGQFDLLPPTYAEIGQMIRYPARDAGLIWDQDPNDPRRYLDDVVQDAAWSDPKALPLLQFTLRELFERRANGRILTFEAYNQLGGLEAALARHAEAQLAGLDRDAQAALPALLRRLVTVGQGAGEPVVARRVPLAPLQADAVRRRLLDVLITARLLATDRADGQAVIGVVHEALLKHWPRLTQLLEKDREFFRTRARVSDAAALWRAETKRDEQKSADFLLAEGKPLTDARDLLARRRDDLDAEVIEYITSSIQTRTRRRRIRTRILLTVTVTVVAVVSTFAGISYFEWAIAERRKDAALQARKTADDQRREAEKQKSLAIRGQLEADEAKGEAEKQRGLAEKRRGEAETQRGLAEQRRREAEETSANLALDRGLTLAAQGDPGSGLLWMARALELAPPERTNLAQFIRASLGAWRPWVSPLRTWVDVPGAIDAAASPAGDAVVTGHADGTLRIWDPDSGEARGTPLRHPGRGDLVAYFIDQNGPVVGSRSVWVTGDETTAWLHIVDPKTGWALGRPLAHDGKIRRVVFRFDGKVVVTGGADGTARFWDAGTGSPIGRPLRHGGAVTCLYYGPGAKVIATAGTDGTARLWDVATSRPLGEPLRHQGEVVDLAFNPDGDRLLTASVDGTARLWDPESGRARAPALVHQGPLTAVRFTPDGKLVLTASQDRTVRVWATATGKPVGEPIVHPGPVLCLAVDDPGKTLLTGGGDKTARLWDLTTRREIGPPLVHDAPVTTVWFATNQNLVVTGTGGWPYRWGPLFVWDAATGTPARGVFASSVNSVSASAVRVMGFSPDGKLVLTSLTFNYRGAVENQLWDVTSGRPVGAAMQLDIQPAIVAFSSDSRFVLTAGVGSWEKGPDEIRLWHTATGRAVCSPLPHPGKTRAVAFSPDGKTVLVASGDDERPGEGRFWDVATGKPIGRALAHGDTVNSVAFRPDGKVAVTTANDAYARLWDAATGQPVGEPMANGGSAVLAIFSPDGGTLLTAQGSDGVVRLWDGATGKRRGLELSHPRGALAAAFSPDGEVVVTGGEDRTARLWDARNGWPIGVPMRHDGQVTSVSFSPDGRTILTASNDNVVRLWDAETGEPIGPPLLHPGLIKEAAFRAGGRSVLTTVVSTDGIGPQLIEFRLLDIARGRPLGLIVQTTRTYRKDITAVAFSPDGKSIVTGGRKVAQRWDARTGIPMGGPMLHSTGSLDSDMEIKSVAFSPDGKILLTAGGGGGRLWNVATGRPIGQPLRAKPEVAGPFSTGASGVFRPDGRQVATWGNDPTARFWDPATGRLLRQLSTPGGILITAASFSRDSRRFVTGSAATAQVWDSTTLGPIGRPLRHQGVVRALVFSPDGRRLLAGDFTGIAQVWDVETGRPAGEPGRHRGQIEALAFRPDGKVVLTASADHTARLWGTETGRPVGEPMIHADAVLAAAFSPDGRLALTAGADAVARLWDADTARPLGAPFVHVHETNSSYAGINAVAFSPDGRRFVTASRDGTARIWDVPEGTTGASKQVILWAEATTGVQIDQAGSARRLDRSAWLALARELSTSGGPPADPDDTPGRIQIRQKRIAQESLYNNRPFTALWHLNNLVSALTRSPDIYRLRAAALDRLNHRAEAIADFSKAIEVEPRNPANWEGRAEVHNELKQWDKALADYSKALDLEGDSARLRSARGLVYGKLSKWEFALADFNRAMILEPESKIFRQDRADTYSALGRWQEAVDDYTEVIKDNVKYSNCWHKRGAALVKLDRLRQALEDYDKAVANYPESRSHRIARANVHAAMRNWAKAAADFEAAIELGDKSSQTWSDLAYVRLVQGDTIGYRRACLALVDIGKRSTDPQKLDQVAWAIVLAPDAVPEIAAVARLTDAAVAGNPKKILYLQTQAAAYFRCGRFQEAAEVLDRRLVAQGKGGDTWDCLFHAMIDARLGRASQAASWLSRGIRQIEAVEKRSAAGDPTTSWQDPTALRVLRREAELLVFDAGMPADPFHGSNR